MEFNDYDYFDFPERLDYIHQVCSGLNYLHEKDILCMDLKPANMLVTGPKENVTVKIADFSEVSLFQTTVTNTSTSKNPLTGI